MNVDAVTALRESEQRFRALVTASSDVVYHMSPDWSEMRQLDGREFIADTNAPNRDWIEQYIFPDDRERVLAEIRVAVEGRRQFHLEHRVVRVDGSVGWTNSRAVPMFDGDGNISEWIGMASDITARKEAETAVATQRRLYEAILTNTPDLAYVWDLDHRFIYVNEGLLRMWGRRWDEAIGKNCLELGYEPWHAEMHGREIEQVKATRLPVRGEVPFTGTFGRRIYDYVLVPVFGAGGEVEAVAGTTRDVTERKQLESSLLEADRRKDEFLATLAHELRNPLAPIRNAVHLLKAQPDTEPPVRAAREIIDRQVHHMVRLVDDLLDVSRITLGQVNLRNDRVTLQQILSDALEAVRPALLESRHELRSEIAPGDIWLDGDPTRLTQVFQNLLDNAVKYTPAGGVITLIVRPARTEVQVTVRDTGVGIEADKLERVFEMFTRVQPEERIKTSGLGIGLSLCKQLLRLHGGRIEARSAGAGRGSEFTVYLPVQSAGSRPSDEPAKTSAAPKASGVRVLIVDDNRDAAESLALILEMNGCEVACAFDGAAALAQLSRHQPDFVLLDIGMPGMNGYEVAQCIRADDSIRQPVLVALTGWGQAEDKARAAEAGFDEHLTKPVDPALLATMLEVRRTRERIDDPPH